MDTVITNGECEVSAAELTAWQSNMEDAINLLVGLSLDIPEVEDLIDSAVSCIREAQDIVNGGEG